MPEFRTRLTNLAAFLEFVNWFCKIAQKVPAWNWDSTMPWFIAMDISAL